MVDEQATITVKAWQCPFDPRSLLGTPLGQFHCELCGCMVLAGIAHGACLPGLCPILDAQGNDTPEWRHPGRSFTYEMSRQEAEMLGLT